LAYCSGVGEHQLPKTLFALLIPSQGLRNKSANLDIGPPSDLEIGTPGPG